MKVPFDRRSPSKTALELAKLEDEAGKLRAELEQLQHDVAGVDSLLDQSVVVQLVEENAQLTAASHLAEERAEQSARQLEQVTREFDSDTLTHLPNRMVLVHRFTQAIADARAKRSRFALLFIDLDNFSRINDLLGHAVGDDALKRAAQCLTESVREVDTVSRLGGDEFAILVTEVSAVAEAVRVAKKIIAALAARQIVNGHPLRLMASIGISTFPDDGEDFETLMARADTAMYVAKRDPRSSVAWHAQPALHLADPAASAVPAKELTHSEQMLIDFSQRCTTLREANEQLVLAALTAQELQAASERAQHRQMQTMAVVAHELRNPLTPIKVTATLLRTARSEDLPRMQAVIERHVGHMARLIGDLLDDSRFKTGKLRLKREAIDLISILQQSIEACRPAMEGRLQHLGVDLPQGPVQMLCDPLRIAQIVGNLLDNASKYSPHGGEIQCCLAATDEAVLITISDTGIGISADALKNVFEPFMQDHHATGFNGEGLGLGLTVVRELVEAHGGTVTAASAGPGLGSQFVVKLPIAAVSAAPIG